MWLKVTPEFPWLCRTHCSVCGIKEGTILGIHIERLRFSPRAGIGTCHPSYYRRCSKVASLITRATYH